ncbi:hypothetical protein AYO45_04380, partial [Gammaproteobacteria bacterium SCGC AG-212-F23]
MSQSLSELWIHIIFSTKKRYPFFTEPSLRQQIYTYIQTICQKKDCHPTFIGGTEDHVHILTRLHKNISLSKLIEEIKKSTSLWIKGLCGSYNILNYFYWQKGYAAFSVSSSKIEAVKQYINNQAKHHEKLNFQDELRK